MADSSGPHLTAALLCERLLQEQDAVLSAIRIVDRLMVARRGPDTPATLPLVEERMTFLLMFKSGAARGRHTVHLAVEKPSGEVGPRLARWPVHFEGEERGVNLVLTALLKLDQEGLFWFDVYLDDERVTRIPLR